MKTDSICPCDRVTHPAVISNAAGLTWLEYRAGDFISFRHALLLPRSGETELVLWRPATGQDLSVMLAEFWAYIADILTFYNEQYVNEHYLPTAVRDEDVRRLVRVLGYRPQPGIGATGTVAAIIQSPVKVQVPVGFQILSKPAPGQSPQTFEVNQAVVLQGASRIEASPPPGSQAANSILLAGEVSGILPGEKLLLVAKNWPTGTFAAWVTVQSTSTEKSPRDVKNTRVTFTANVSAMPSADTLRLLRPNQGMGLWPYSATTVATTTQIHLAGLAREAAPGTILLLEVSGTAFVRTVDTYSELVWYANNTDPAHPETPPVAPAVPVSIPHTVLTFSAVSTDPNPVKATVRARFDWRDAGRPIPTPAQTASGASLTLTAATETLFPAMTLGQKILVEDATLAGTFGIVAQNQAASASLPLSGIAGTLQAPLKTLVHLLEVSRGKTVKSEVLGSGDATQTGQEFVLKKAPLTYLPNSDPMSASVYSSTLRVWVDGIEWKEASSFFSQPADARIFVTREDEENNTHVLFGDGVNGARLPSGSSNVTAAYRYESGAAVPDAGALSVLGQSLPGLSAIRNPVPPSGGDDPDPSSDLRRLAPQSVLTFGRAVSGLDYEVIAAQAPGVTRARAYWSYDVSSQRTTVRVYVGDNTGAVDSARNALKKASDPNRALTIQLATARPVQLVLTLIVDPAYLPDPVVTSVRDALLNAETGLFGLREARIGHILFRSRVYAACLAVAGVTAVHQLVFKISTGTTFTQVNSYRYNAGEGNYFQLDDANLTVNWESPEA